MTLGQLPPRTSPAGTTTRARRLAAPLLGAGVVGGLTLALHYRDPHVQGSWGFCPFRALTGLDCPGCGGLRAVHDLTNLDVAGAASSNLLLVLMVPVVLVLWLAWTRRAWRSDRPLLASVSRPMLWGQVALVVIAIFTVARNLPIGGWLAA